MIVKGCEEIVSVDFKLRHFIPPSLIAYEVINQIYNHVTFIK